MSASQLLSGVAFLDSFEVEPEGPVPDGSVWLLCRRCGWRTLVFPDGAEDQYPHVITVWNLALAAAGHFDESHRADDGRARESWKQPPPF